MAFPKVAFEDRELIVINGFSNGTDNTGLAVIKIREMDDLRKVAKRHPEAIAFGYLNAPFQRWVAAA